MRISVTAEAPRRWRVIATAVAAASLSACSLIAGKPDAAEKIAAAEAAVAQAEQIAGPSSPEVRIAREKLMNAQRAAAEDNQPIAQRSAEQAEADARLAIARFEAQRARDAGEAIARTLLPDSPER